MPGPKRRFTLLPFTLPGFSSHDPRAGQAVVQELSIAIEERPQKSAAKEQQRRPGEGVAQQRPAGPDGEASSRIGSFVSRPARSRTTRITTFNFFVSSPAGGRTQQLCR